MNFKIDHIGYLTGDIGKTTEQFELLGFSVVGGVIYDNTRKPAFVFYTRKEKLI